MATNSVNVNSQTPYRKGEYFRKEISVSNGSVPVWQSVTVSAPNETTASGNVFAPKTAEAFGYDADGNLTSDGRWTYTWDGENRLVQLVANTSIGPQQLIKFEYDWKSRRIHKQLWPNTGGTGTLTLDEKFLYDAWNLVADLNATNNAVVRSLVWGLDLSGTLQGAGGVGGLIELSYYGSQTTNCFAAFDGNGNVAALASSTDAKILAQYEYGPFGEALRRTGPIAKANPFQFSTKYQDDETELLYYGYRYFNPAGARWVHRDPQDEGGGYNLFAFLENDPLNNVEFLGLQSATAKVEQSYIAALHRYLNKKSIETTGYMNAMARYHRLLPRIKIEEKVMSVMALYDPHTHVLSVDSFVPIVARPTLSHELAHVYDDLALGIGSDQYEEIDEANGYSMGSFSDAVEGLWKVEDAVTAGDCASIYSTGAKRWHELWRSYGKIPSRNWGDVLWSGGSRPLQSADYQRFAKTHGVCLSCSAIAAALNETVWDKQCCASFVCSAQGGAGEIGTGVQIDDIFK